jgi:hypothetical protein
MTNMTGYVIDTEEGVVFSVLAREFNTTARTLRRWAADGSLPAWRAGEHGPWYARREDVVARYRHSHEPRQRRQHDHRHPDQERR